MGDIPRNTYVIIVTHRKTGLYHVLTTRETTERAAVSLMGYWNEIGKRTHKFLNFAVVEFARHLAPFKVSDFEYVTVTEKPLTPQEAKAAAIHVVTDRGTDKLLTSQLGFNGASWVLNTYAKYRLDNCIPPPYLELMKEVDEGSAEIRRGGQDSLKPCGDNQFVDTNEDQYEKLSVEEIARHFGEGYLVTSSHRGVRIYRKQ